MRVLDLFCGGGGASAGYSRAGFFVEGVDIAPQPNYPFMQTIYDAVAYLREADLARFDLIHASPPCQGYSTAVHSRSSDYSLTKGADEPRLIEPVREALRRYAPGVPYVIENVKGAVPYMRSDLMLCGSMFNLYVNKHRYFEIEHGFVQQPPHPKCTGRPTRYAKRRGWDSRDTRVAGKTRNAGTIPKWRELMEVDWDATGPQLAEMIPPAYTEYIGLWLAPAIREAKKQHNPRSRP